MNLSEEYKNRLKKLAGVINEGLSPDVIQYDIENENGETVGDVNGIVHYDIQYLKNWMEMEHVDEKTQQFILSNISMPVAILKNINIYDDYKNQGFGNNGMEQFFNEAIEANYILLIVDNGESNAFSLEKWYEGFGFKTIGQAGGLPVMIYSNQ